MLDHFFICGTKPNIMNGGTYSYLLVALSYVIACFSSYAGLTLAVAMADAKSSIHKNILHIGGAFALGCGIWSMHFTGMLALDMGMGVVYDALRTGASLLIAVGTAYGVLAITNVPRISWRTIACGSVLLGLAICSMHYIGMSAMILDADVRYRPVLFGVSIAIAVGTSAAALYIVFKLGNYSGGSKYIWRALASLIMGMAVCGMHYTGMEAAVFIPHSTQVQVSANGVGNLAYLIALAAALICLMAIIGGKFGATFGVGIVDKNPFPKTLLTLSIVMTGLFIAWAGSSAFYLRHELDIRAHENLQISLMADQAGYLNSDMGDAVKNALMTGDMVWEKNYATDQIAYGDVIANIEGAISQSRFSGNAEAAKIYALARKVEIGANANLWGEEWKAFHLMDVGQRDKAIRTLNDPDYLAARKAYLYEVHRLAIQTDSILSASFGSLDTAISCISCVSVVMVVVLPLLWFYAFRSLRRWRTELNHARVALLDNEWQLQQSIRRIEAAKSDAVEAQKAAERANAAKSDFLANMSHELRTPLNSVLGMLRLLKEGWCESHAKIDEEYKLVDTAFRASGNLLLIVNDILDLSKIEAGEMKLENIGMDIGYILESACITLETAARDKGLRLIFDKGASDFPYVLGDPTRFNQILVNLIGNAIKYTDKGQIEVKASFEYTNATQMEFLCAIIDTGIGIAPEKQQYVFGKFIQADNSTTRQYGGTGLGLAIVKQLVTLMKGTIGVASELGRGSTFWFNIPLEVTDASSQLSRIRRRYKQRGTILPGQARVLVAEDHPLNQLLIEQLLHRFGIGSVKIVANGELAIDAYKEGEWDIILMDCHMPEKDGYDATHEIRRLERQTARRTPIIAMTANAMMGEREKCLGYGMSEYLTKPIVFEELKDVMGQWLDFSGAPKEKSVMPKARSKAFDLSSLRDLTGGDENLLKTFIATFVEQSDKNIDLLTKAAESNDIDSWHKNGHMFKGGALGIGATNLAHLCQKAQMFEGSPADQKQLLQAIDVEYKCIKSDLSSWI